MELTFYIENNQKKIYVPIQQKFIKGNPVILSNSNTDVTHKFDWYQKGFTIQKFVSDSEFTLIKEGIKNSLKEIIEKIGKKVVSNFEIEKYHEFITSNEEHYNVVTKTRDLFENDFSFDINYLIPKLEKILKIKLTDFDELNNYKSHIILRINRPNSNDFNPPHKDIYEHFDGEGYVPKFINFWIPICGVTEKSTLPLVPSSHMISEDLIERTVDGSIVGNNKYRVRLIKEWNGQNKLLKPKVDYGEVLIFTPHLIHGLSLNEENNTTRIALEFRLYEKNN